MQCGGMLRQQALPHRALPLVAVLVAPRPVGPPCSGGAIAASCSGAAHAPSSRRCSSSQAGERRRGPLMARATADQVGHGLLARVVRVPCVLGWARLPWSWSAPHVRPVWRSPAGADDGQGPSHFGLALHHPRGQGEGVYLRGARGRRLQVNFGGSLSSCILLEATRTRARTRTCRGSDRPQQPARHSAAEMWLCAGTRWTSRTRASCAPCLGWSSSPRTS